MDINTIISIEKRKNELPALSDHTFLRYFNFIALYLAQGIPEGMLYFGLPAWMAVNGKSPGEIGAFVAVVTTPWTFKVLIAPLMDRFTYLPMGKRRPWVLTGRLGLMVFFVLMSIVPDPLNNMTLFTLAAFMVSFSGALQDVSTDGMAIDIIPIEQQARANGFMWGSKTIGISASLYIGSHLINSFGYHTAILSLACAVCIIMIVPATLKERPGEKILPWTKGIASSVNLLAKVNSWSEIGKSLLRVMKLRNSLLMIFPLFFATTGFGLMNTLLPIFTIQQLGWTNIHYSEINATASLAGGIGGMMICGILLDKFGKVKMLSFFLVLLMLLPLSIILLKNYWNTPVFMNIYISTYNFLYVFSTIGMFAVAMKLCWKKVSATQFTLFMVAANLGLIAGPAIIGFLKNKFSWDYIFLTFSLMMILTLILVQFLRTDDQLHAISLMEEQEQNIAHV